ncbi:hypothetical protein BG006_001887 [Podila minutissima]|uniref:Uncharacterized protein n=1 Tax=Podila minutissima TaxID=64525 RepID=A0A9P5SVQ2_9FUNG|nr:hypothetical protein BG006_001887 [Podila minutissima]
MQDAIILSNYLYALKDKTPESLNSAFKGYFEEGEPFARAAFETSDHFWQFFRRRIYAVIRLVVAYLPQWVWRRAFDKMYGYRPQSPSCPASPTADLSKPSHKRISKAAHIIISANVN